MMMKSMSLGARRELQAIIKQKYHNASWADRSKLLDGFVAATGYERKYAIQLLNSGEMPILQRSGQHPKSMTNNYDKL